MLVTKRSIHVCKFYDNNYDPFFINSFIHFKMIILYESTYICFKFQDKLVISPIIHQQFHFPIDDYFNQLEVWLIVQYMARQLIINSGHNAFNSTWNDSIATSICNSPFNFLLIKLIQHSFIQHLVMNWLWIFQHITRQQRHD